MSEPILDIQNLQVAFATDAGTVNAVAGVSLQVQPGEVLAVVGESGSGKSVTARSVLGLLPGTATAKGAILLNGHDVLTLSAEQLRAADAGRAVREAVGLRLHQHQRLIHNPHIGRHRLESLARRDDHPFRR